MVVPRPLEVIFITFGILSVGIWAGIGILTLSGRESWECINRYYDDEPVDEAPHEIDILQSRLQQPL